MKVWLIMVEQYYADLVRPEGIFSTKEKAEAHKEKMRLGDDVHIYEVLVDDPDPYIG